MRELALHILDIAENSVAAGARKVLIAVEEDLPKDRLRIVVEDDGRGMEEELLSRVTDPFVTSRTTRKVGLGIPLLKAAAEACNGCLRLTSTVGKGTRLEVEFQHSHIDRMPLGDLAGTILTLVVGHPTVNWVFVYRVGQAEFTFDDNPIKQELDGIPLTEPSILAFIKEMLREGIAQAQQDGRARE